MSALSGDVDIPKVGKFPKTAIVIGVGGVVALIIWQNQKNSAAAAAAAAVDPNAIDPSTGLPYGDASASGSGYYGGGSGYATGLQTSASYPWDGTYGQTSDPYSMDSSTGQTYGAEGYSGSVSSYSAGTGGPPFSTNAQWSQYVLNYFAGSDNLQAMTDAIGLYLAGQTVSSAQQGLVNDATAVGGTPPVSGAGGYPPAIKTAGSTAGGTGPSAGHGAAPASAPSGIFEHTVGAVTTVQWGTVSGATGYELQLATPSGAVYKDGRSAATSATFDNLIDAGGAHKGYGTWHYKVRAYNAAGNGPWSAVQALGLAAPKK